RQFLAEAIALATTGGLMGVAAGWGLAGLIAYVSPLPAKVTLWSIVLALALGAGVGVLFGVYPAARAAQLDPIGALRQEYMLAEDIRSNVSIAIDTLRANKLRSALTILGVVMGVSTVMAMAAIV